MKKFNEYLEQVHEQRDGKWGTWIGLSEVRALPAVKQLEKFGYQIVSTDRQLKNGTLVFENDATKKQGIKFEITANGRIGRRVVSKWNNKMTDVNVIGKNQPWSGQPVEDMETLKQMIQYLANYVGKHSHYQNIENVNE